MCSPELEKSFTIERSHSPTIASVYDDPEVIETQEFLARLKPVFEGGAVARPSTVTGDLYNSVSIAYHTRRQPDPDGAGRCSRGRGRGDRSRAAGHHV